MLLDDRLAHVSIVSECERIVLVEDGGAEVDEGRIVLVEDGGAEVDDS